MSIQNSQTLLQEADALELFEQLSKKAKPEIEHVLYKLLIINKIDFLSVQNAYIKYLECLKRVNLAHIKEAEVCLVESLTYDRIPNNTRAEKSVQRRLYYLNYGRRVQMQSLNKKFNYDEERAKIYSNEAEEIELAIQSFCEDNRR